MLVDVLGDLEILREDALDCGPFYGMSENVVHGDVMCDAGIVEEDEAISSMASTSITGSTS